MLVFSTIKTSINSGTPIMGKPQIHHHPSKVLQAVLPRNASLILDLCAAPGSKSTQLAHDFAGHGGGQRTRSTQGWETESQLLENGTHEA